MSLPHVLMGHDSGNTHMHTRMHTQPTHTRMHAPGRHGPLLRSWGSVAFPGRTCRMLAGLRP